MKGGVNMEWIRISKSKLKIMLSAEDAERYALNCESADYADLMTRDAFKEILTDVRQETGFDATEDKVYIQMYPSKEGGCELFVTKLGLLLTEEDHEAPSGTKHQHHTAPQNAKQPQTVRKKSTSLVFTQLDHLLALCRRLASTYSGESEVWLDESGAWWLILTEEIDPKVKHDDLCFIREYGQTVSTDKARAFLPEHGRAIYPSHAVQKFQDF
jgi:negative regulator of genetic competence, sporulation and motility